MSGIRRSSRSGSRVAPAVPRGIIVPQPPAASRAAPSRAAPRRQAGWLARVAHAVRSSVPAACPLCLGAARGGELCSGCLDDLVGVPPHPRCPACGQRTRDGCACGEFDAAYEHVVVAIDYAPPGDALVLQFKQSLRYGRAPLLAGLLAAAVDRHPLGLAGADVLAPVPSSPQALRRRGFNPAAETARALGARLGMPVAPLLRHTGADAGRQSGLARGARMARGVRFQAAGRCDGLLVGVVDDVMTTGATLHAAALAAREAGAAGVVALAVARTPPGARPGADGAGLPS